MGLISFSTRKKPTYNITNEVRKIGKKDFSVRKNMMTQREFLQVVPRSQSISTSN